MLHRMDDYIQSVVVRGKVYVGGGRGRVGGYSSNIIMEYDSVAKKWSKLPSYITGQFSMAVVNRQLVLVGGDNKSTGVGVWKAGSKEWIYPYPDMPTPRSCCSAVAHFDWLVVAGGSVFKYTSIVEVLNTDTKHWYVGPSTPKPWIVMKTALVGDVCYFMGGYVEDQGNTAGGTTDYSWSAPTDVVYRLSFPALVSYLTSDSSSKTETEIWKAITGLDMTYSTPLSLNGCLLTFGGRNKDREIMTGIHLYQTDTGTWVKIGDLPAPRYECTCSLITERQLFVAGGYHTYDKLRRMDIAVIKVGF